MYEDDFEHFHTIKSILNTASNSIKNHFESYFHTIKSILNCFSKEFS